MANTSENKGNVIEVTLDGTTAWQYDTATHGWTGVGDNGVKLWSIEWIPNAADDVISITDGKSAANDPQIFYAKAVDAYDMRIKYFPPMFFKPVVNTTTTTGAGQIVIFTRR